MVHWPDHRFPDTDRFTRKMQIAEIDYIRGSRAAQTTVAENYVGLSLQTDRSSAPVLPFPKAS